jgi:hypothetical protein
MSPPTDLELMMFHDGELDEARNREVELYLQADDSAAKSGTSKLAGLGLLSSLVVESQVPVARAQEKQADSIASLVIAKIESEKKPTASEAPRLDGAVPANDNNGRFIMVLAGLAAAAAAALFVWGRSAPPDTPSAAVDTVQAPAEEAVAPAPVETVAALPSPSATTSAVAPTVEEAESEPSVEVASVDFSAASGAVYYVPSDSAGQTTAVVWLKDE